MTKKAIAACCVTAVIVFALVFDGNVAQSQPKEDKPMNIGVVSVKRIFDESEKNQAFKEQLNNEQERVLAQLEKARADIEAERAGLKTLKPGTSEQMEQMKVLMEKQAKLTAEQEFQKQKLAVRQRRWIEQLYGDILRIARDIAQERDLDLVLENSQIELSEVPDDTLVMSILMRTAVYAEGCVDLTDEVMARLDAGK